MHLFDPSSTTFVKHFIVTNQYKSNPNYSNNLFVAGMATLRLQLQV